MPRTSKFRRRSIRNEESEINDDTTYLYPRHRLYTKKENELLDSIYATDAQTDDDVINHYVNGTTTTELDVDNEAEDFWKQSNKDLFAPENQKIKYLPRIGWFACGAAVASLIWMIFFQVNVNLIKAQADTKIVFQNAPSIVTDKDLDKEISGSKTKKEKVEKDFNVKIPFFGEWFNSKQPEPVFDDVVFDDSDDAREADKNAIEERVETALAAENAATIEVPESIIQKRNIPFGKPNIKSITIVKEAVNSGPQFHIVENGDSLWTIAQKYYGNPSPSNIRKIREANNLRSTFMKLGQKLVIPL